jgi:hypothetical protein
VSDLTKDRIVRRLPVFGTLPDRALWRATTYTSRLGERHELDWLTYNPLQLLAYHRIAARHAPGVARAFLRTFPSARRYADVGAGGGAYAAALRQLGRQVDACEHARSGRAIARLQGVRSRPFELTREPPARLTGTYDVAYSIEVAEHVPPELGDRLVAVLAGLAPAIVFTAAQPGQGGLGHINEQPLEYWIERFRRHGVEEDAVGTTRLTDALRAEGVRASWLLENALVLSAAIRGQSNSPSTGSN